jgi:hypothetical protein
MYDAETPLHDAGLRLTDARAVTGPPDVWLRLPERDYWR